MQRIEAIQEIRAFQEANQPRQVIVRYLEGQGVSKTSAYRWINEANNLDADGNAPRDLAIKATIQILNKATQCENYEIALRAAATLAKFS